MEFFDTVLSYASMAVTGFGGAIAIGGIIDFGEGKSQQAAAKQSEGMTKIVGGGIIIAVGVFLVPKLADLLETSTTVGMILAPQLATLLQIS